jgi:hypothetical protein
MEFSVVLNHLQNQFSGSLVLYVDDIAKILGKSEKAVANLIARDALPFKVKTVGGKRCVDIFQIAQWFCSDTGMAQECVAPSAEASPPSVKIQPVPARPLKPIKLAQAQKQSTSAEKPVLTGTMAAAILKMRHAQSTAMGRFIHGLTSGDEVAFMLEVMEKLFSNDEQTSTDYVVTIGKVNQAGEQLLAVGTPAHFEIEDQACDLLMHHLNEWRFRKPSPEESCVEYYVLKHLEETLFYATTRDQKLTVTVNEVGMEFPGE